MSVETYYKQGPIRKVESYGGSTKLLVSDLLSLDPMLSLYSVEIDTQSTYSCYLRVSNSKMLVKINNASSILEFHLYYIDSSDKLVKITYSNMSYSSLNQQCRAVVWGIGDCLRYFSIVYTTNNGLVFTYEILNSETYNEEIVCTNVSSISNISFPIPKGSIYPIYFYNSELNLSQKISFLDLIPNDPIKKSGNNYNLLQISYMGNSATNGFLNINFGEGHKLYQLYNGSDKVTTQVGEMVTINGKQIMSIGDVIYAE